MAAVLINAWDPRRVNVVLYDNRYYGHIVERHPAVTIEHIRMALEDPDIITGDDSDPLVENFYARGVMPDAPEYWLKVCVRFNSDVGKVVTAYEVDRPKPTEHIRWQP